LSILRSMVVGLSLCTGVAARSPAQDCSGATFFVSSAAVVGLAVFDIATAPAAVRRYNERHLTVSPAMNLRDRSYGLSVSWSFGRTPVPRPAQSVVANRRKSPATGLLLSLGATTVPMASGIAIGPDAGAWIFLGGVVVGPSMGHFYAGQVGRGLGTTALRAAGAAVGISSLVGCFSD
jgi:hypothetical protein